MNPLEILTYDEALKKACAELGAAGLAYPSSEARYLLSYVTGLDMAVMFARGRSLVEKAAYKQFCGCVKKRAEGMPFAYITGKKEFMGLEFTVNNSVLIPRADTEILAQCAIDFIKSRPGKDKKLLDLCTGSGAVGISVARFCEIEAVLSDISQKALAVCELNAKALIPGRYYLAHADLFTDIAPDKKALTSAAAEPGYRFGEKLWLKEGGFTAITANPPYISEKEFSTLSGEVTKYEPQLALLADKDGLYFYEQIIPQAKDYLSPRGGLFVECGYDQTERVKQIFEENGYGEITISYDLGGNPRVVKGIRL